MKISDVRTYVLEGAISEPFGYSQGWVGGRSGLLLEIVTDDGISGWGEAFGPPRPNAAWADMFRPLLRGKDPLATEQLWEVLFNTFRGYGRMTPLETISAIDIALWDIKGKYFGLPVHRLLGGPLRERVQAYATGFYRRKSGDAVQYLCAEADECLAEGITALKIRVGFGVEDDIRVCRALRKHVGPNVSLMIDANHAYDAVSAIRLATAIEDLDIEWFEEPVPSEDLAGFLQIKSKTKIPMAGGETEFTRWSFREIIRQGALDILQPDVCAAGGISECKKIADMASAFGVRCYPHVWGTAVGMAASLQLLAVLPHSPPSLHAIEPLLEFDRSEHPFRTAILENPPELERGWMQIPQGAGLGIEVSREALKRFTTA